MNPKERVLAALKFQPVDRVPYSFGFTQSMKRTLQDYFGTLDLDAAMGNHIVSLTINPGHGYHPLDYEGDTYQDEWGVVWGGDLRRDRGYPVQHPLSRPSLEGYRFPNPTDERRFSHLAPTRSAYPDRFIVAQLGVGGLWERGFFMRGWEELLVDLHENPAFVDDLLDAIADYHVRTVGILADRYGTLIDGINIPDDYGTQADLLFSPTTWRRFFKPRLARVFGAIKAKGYPAFLHSDGNITKIIPDLLEIGLDVLHPVQVEAMDVDEVKAKYGGRLVIYGGIGTQGVLSTGTPDDVRGEVRSRVASLGKGGGFIASAISIQHDMSLDNLRALLDELQRSTP